MLWQVVLGELNGSEGCGACLSEGIDNFRADGQTGHVKHEPPKQIRRIFNSKKIAIIDPMPNSIGGVMQSLYVRSSGVYAEGNLPLSHAAHVLQDFWVTTSENKPIRNLKLDFNFSDLRKCWTRVSQEFPKTFYRSGQSIPS